MSTALSQPSDAKHKAALRDELRRRAVDPEFKEERRERIAAKQAKRMRNVVVVLKVKRA
ncbi:hypothetical protein [Bradyrhizobium elkanii]|uniref:hypothetical protein n=1 Tax=Bradyrhizobium elkanii TaxID=29448 RepID=UPI0003FD25AE|nr:hypothetical protein [Bradyrhizobium elkanii]